MWQRKKLLQINFFLSIDIWDFYYFLCKNCDSPEKIEILSSPPPPYWNVGRRLDPPPPVHIMKLVLVFLFGKVSKLVSHFEDTTELWFLREKDWYESASFQGNHFESAGFQGNHLESASFQGNHIWVLRLFKVTQLWWFYPPMHRNRLLVYFQTSKRSCQNKTFCGLNSQFSLFESYIAISTNFSQRQKKNFHIA